MTWFQFLFASLVGVYLFGVLVVGGLAVLTWRSNAAHVPMGLALPFICIVAFGWPVMFPIMTAKGIKIQRQIRKETDRNE